LCQAPNFAYGLVARKWLEKKYSSKVQSTNFSLDSVQHMINGAEPVNHSDISFFYHIFSKYGLADGVVYPTYGLAEHTVFVTSSSNLIIQVPKHQIDEGKIEPSTDMLEKWTYDEGVGGKGEYSEIVTLVGCGSICSMEEKEDGGEMEKKESDDVVENSFNHNIVIKIVYDPTTKNEEDEGGSLVERKGENNEPYAYQSDGYIGEIWISSPSVAQGYWIGNDPSNSSSESTAINEAFQGRLKDDPLTYLKTGDVGFIHKSHLFICGRSKDMLVIRGRNIYPNDIERAIEDLFDQDLRKGNSTLFDANSILSQNVVLSPKSRHKKRLLLERSGSNQSNNEGEGNNLVWIGEMRNVEKFNESGFSEMCNVIHQHISQNFALNLSKIILCSSHSIPKTTSGKISRSKTRLAYLKASIPFEHVFTKFSSNSDADNNREEKEGDEMRNFDSSQDILLYLCERVSILLGQGWEGSSDSSKLEVPFERIESLSQTSLPHLGLDSMESIGLIADLQDTFGVYFPDEVMFDENVTLEALSEILWSGEVPPPPLSIESIVDGSSLSVPLARLKTDSGESQVFVDNQNEEKKELIKKFLFGKSSISSSILKDLTFFQNFKLRLHLMILTNSTTALFVVVPFIYFMIMFGLYSVVNWGREQFTSNPYHINESGSDSIGDLTLEGIMKNTKVVYIIFLVISYSLTYLTAQDFLANQSSYIDLIAHLLDTKLVFPSIYQKTVDGLSNVVKNQMDLAKGKQEVKIHVHLMDHYQGPAKKNSYKELIHSLTSYLYANHISPFFKLPSSKNLTISTKIHHNFIHFTSYAYQCSSKIVITTQSYEHKLKKKLMTYFSQLSIEDEMRGKDEDSVIHIHLPLQFIFLNVKKIKQNNPTFDDEVFLGVRLFLPIFHLDFVIFSLQFA